MFKKNVMIYIFIIYDKIKKLIIFLNINERQNGRNDTIHVLINVLFLL